MATSYGTFGNFLLLKQRAQDGLGSLWRAGEMERGGFTRFVWLRRFDVVGLDRTALEADAASFAQISQLFKATNVVRNAVFGSEDTIPYLAWDYVPAQPLSQLFERVANEQFPVAIDNALLITEKIAAALAAALAVEVGGEPLIHGFLVPSMVMIGNDGEAQVAGFGLGRGLLANLDRVSVQEMAAPYLAPEVMSTLHGSRRGDVYSLGAILYQLLAGVPLPRDAQQRAQVLAAPRLHVDEAPIPDDIAAILRKALAPRPEDRYSSAADFKRELEKLLYGGAYSPTTFNLALFMDRLFRQDIEEEDRELQREKTIDVTPYYKPPKAAGPEVAAAPPPASRTGLYVALGGVVVLLAVIAYLLFGRPAPKPVDEEAQRRMLTEIISSQVAEALKQKEQELERVRQETEALRKQLAQQTQAAASGERKLTAEEQRKQEELRQELARREAEQRQREAELQRLREETAKAAVTASRPTVAPVAPAPATPIPTAAPAATPAPTVAPTEPPRALPTEAPAPVAPAAAALTEGVREGDYVPFAQVDTPPQELVTQKPTLPRAAVMARAGQGVVILKATVNAKGLVEAVEVLRGFPTQGLGVDEACVEAVKQYRYKPATKGGVRVKTDVTVTIRVDLTRTR